MTTITDVAQSHGLNEPCGHFVDICGHFTGILQGWSIDYGKDICLLYQRMGRRIVVKDDILDSVGPEHYVNGME